MSGSRLRGVADAIDHTSNRLEHRGEVATAIILDAIAGFSRALADELEAHTGWVRGRIDDLEQAVDR